MFSDCNGKWGDLSLIHVGIIMYICKGFVRFQPLAKDADVEQVGRSRIKKQGGGWYHLV